MASFYTQKLSKFKVLHEGPFAIALKARGSYLLPSERGSLSLVIVFNQIYHLRIRGLNLSCLEIL